MNVGDTSSFAQSLTRLTTMGGRAMKRGVTRDFDKETMKTNDAKLLVLKLIAYSIAAAGCVRNVI